MVMIDDRACRQVQVFPTLNVLGLFAILTNDFGVFRLWFHSFRSFHRSRDARCLHSLHSLHSFHSLHRLGGLHGVYSFRSFRSWHGLHTQGQAAQLTSQVIAIIVLQWCQTK